MALPGLDTVLPGIFTARYAGGSIMLGGIDILASVSESQSVLSFAYSDNTSDKADDLTVIISDPARTWMQSFLPKKGVECEATIKVFNWMAPGDTREFNCGTMWVDEISMAGPPNTVTMKAVSIPVNTGIKTQRRYQFWEGQPLQAIAGEIAAMYSLALVWDATDSPVLKRTDVIETAHLEYLRDRCKDEGLSIKIFNRQLIIYSEAEYEARPPIYVMTYGLSQILSYEFVSRLNDTYQKSTVSYVSPITGKYINGEFVPPFKPEGTGSDLDSYERVEEDDQGEGGEDPILRAKALGDTISYASENAIAAEAAKRKAKSKLREKNKREKECIIAVVGNPMYLSGLSMQLIGFGTFDGKWFIVSSTHSISEDGYQTELRMRACLEGY